MTALSEALVKRIDRDGPISVAAYMEACLYDPVHGYYRTRSAIGRAGDFITAPEISQVFGELIGLWCAVVWHQMGAPPSCRLVELGPGRGTLMRDALRAARAVPDFVRALEVHLVETNPTLETEQRATLADAGVAPAWHGDLCTLARGGPVIVIANEFLDTLPVEQWVRRGAAWRQRCVGVDGEGRLAFVDGAPDATLRLPAGLERAAREDDIYESRDAALRRLSGDLAAVGAPLAALLIDYGHIMPALGSTVQAVRAHHYADPLAEPGEADLTAQVDFATAADAMQGSGFVCDGPVTQAELLGSLGIAERASRLMSANPAHAARIEGDVARLMAPGGMGTRFLAVGVRSAHIARLPGF